MKENYLSPTIYNSVNMKLSGSTRKDSGALSLENPVEGAWLPAVALSASIVAVIGRKDIGEKGASFIKRKI